MNDDNNNSDLNPEALAIDEPGVHIVNEPLIPAYVLNIVTPSIISTPKNIFSTRPQTAIDKCEDLSTYTINGDNVAYSNADFDLDISDSSDFIDATEKDDMVNYVNTSYRFASR